MKKIIGVLFLLSCSFCQAMEKPTGRPIFAPASIITPEQEAEIAKLPEQERKYKLHDLIVHNVLQESETFDDAVKKINELAKESEYKDILAFDIDYIKRYGTVEWLVQQQHAELDAIMKLYVYALTHPDIVANKDFVISLRKALPGLDKLEMFIERNSKQRSEVLAQVILQLSKDSAIAPLMNSYPLLENILNRFTGGAHSEYWTREIVVGLRTPAAAEFIKKETRRGFRARIVTWNLTSYDPKLPL